jgi:acetylornithine deacetylase
MPNLIMPEEVIKLSQELVAIPSETTDSNAAVCDFLQGWLQARGFAVERVSYIDNQGEEKVNLIAQRGNGTGGLGFFAHSDTVPGDAREWDPFDPIIRNGKLIGRGSCDMKGPLAATMLAAAGIDANRLRKPVYLVIASDEEQGHLGAHYLIEHAITLQENWPEYAVVAEPTELQPVYAHKGSALITVTSHGKAAHTSTEKGISANFRIAPFLADMAALVPVFRSTERFKNYEFDPPTNGFNLVIDDGNCRPNVTAAVTVAQVSLRLMPNDHREEQIAMIEQKAEAYDLQVHHRIIEPFYIDPNAAVIQAACRATGIPKAITVPFGTEAEAYQKFTQAVVLGPGSIAQAHTRGEWIDIGQLQDAVGVYENMIAQLCM